MAALNGNQQSPTEANRHPVELARACASALSFVSGNRARDVHILSLRRAYSRVGSPGELRYATRILNFIGEIQDLGFGYWFPAPTRAVHTEHFAMVLSVSPTWELSRHFAVTVQGIGRTASRSDVQHLARQQLADWLGAGEADATESELAKLLSRSSADMQPASPDQHVEYFSRGGRRPNLAAFWSRDPSRATLIDSKTLCRRRISDTFARYFIGEVSPRGLIGESAEVDDPDYAQYAFALGSGAPVEVEKRVSGQMATFTFPIQPPRAERKLLLTLARRTRHGTSYAYSAKNESAALIERQINRLGVRVRSLQ